MISYSDIKSDLIDSSHGQLGKINSVVGLVNRACRRLNNKIDMRGTEKESALVAGTDDYEYDAPTDMKRNAVINVLDSDKTAYDAEFIIVPTYQEFQYHQINYTSFGNVILMDSIDGSEKLYIYSDFITPAYIRYYSTDYVLDIDGVTYKSSITGDGDQLVFDEAYYEVLLTECELLVDRYNREISTGDYRIDQEYNDREFKNIQNIYPSERLEIISTT